VNLSGANEHFSQQLTPVFDALREQGAPVMQTRANGLLKGMSVESRDIGRFPQANSFRQGLSPHIAGLSSLTSTSRLDPQRQWPSLSFRVDDRPPQVVAQSLEFVGQVSRLEGGEDAVNNCQHHGGSQDIAGQRAEHGVIHPLNRQPQPIASHTDVPRFKYAKHS
jgi:hypothetical protein